MFGMYVSFLASLLVDFFVAMGMVIGGSLLGGIAAWLNHTQPMATMVALADKLKIWALVSTLGGTMDTLRVIETGLLGMKWSPVVKQFAYLTSAFIGCQFGYLLIRWFAGSDVH